MARKLVFDRTLWIAQKRDAEVVVPDDELWKVGLGNCGALEVNLQDTYFSSSRSERIIGGGATIKLSSNSMLTGIAFKVVEQ